MAKSSVEKIDFLMKLTNTQNATLGRALNYDASYISRIRAGYQKAALAEEMRLHRAWSADEQEAAALLSAWLHADPDAQSPVERVIAAMREGMPRPAPLGAEYPAGDGSRLDAAMFYGNEGKRDGVVAFLSALAATDSPHTLLLASDEDMTWLFEDEAFVRAWASLMGRLIQGGSRSSTLISRFAAR